MRRTTKRFIGILEKEPDTLFGIWFPDLPGCTSAGETADEALQNATKAVRLWAESALDDGETIPQPRPLDDLLQDADVKESLKAGATTTLVPLYLSSGRTTRVNISVDTGYLAAIDDAAAQFGQSRSAFILDAAREKIGM